LRNASASATLPSAYGSRDEQNRIDGMLLHSGGYRMNTNQRKDRARARGESEMLDNLMVAQSFDGAYTYHVAHRGGILGLCSDRLMQEVKELPLSLWRTGAGIWCRTCDALLAREHEAARADAAEAEVERLKGEIRDSLSKVATMYEQWEREKQSLVQRVAELSEEEAG